LILRTTCGKKCPFFDLIYLLCVPLIMQQLAAGPA
jgi:hypothetical protein